MTGTKVKSKSKSKSKRVDPARRKSRRVKKSRNKILYLIAALVGAIFIFSAATMALAVSNEIDEQPPPKRIEKPHLKVEEVFFIKANSESRTDGELDPEEEFIDIDTTVYLTNDGLADAENVAITAIPRDNKYNLGSCKTEMTIGKIPKQKTAEAEFVIHVKPGEKHDVDLLIFEDELLIMSGSGSVVTSGGKTSAQQYKTDVVSGTNYDKDYDGMPDAWENYYGLNPSDPRDANKDADGDGISNLAEYQGNTTPSRKYKDDGDAEAVMSMSNDRGLFGLVIVFIIIIIIIIIIGLAMIKNPSKQENKNKKSDNTPSPWGNQYSTPAPYQQPYQQPHWRCPKCGGWLDNGVCVNCSGRNSVTPVQVQPFANESEKDNTPKP